MEKEREGERMTGGERGGEGGERERREGEWAGCGVGEGQKITANFIG